MNYNSPYNDRLMREDRRRMDFYGDRMRHNMDPPQPLPYVTMDEALSLIQEAVSGETEDRAFYEYLIEIAPTNEDKNIIFGIRNDEMGHYDMFRQLYYELTKRNIPPVPNEPFIQPATYCDGLRNALMGEQNAVAKYRKILFAMKDRRYINTMTMIITDEIRHLGLYNYLYSKNSCNV